MYIQQNSNQDLQVNLHIIGVQKAGTSALAHFLSQHPDICLVEGKEAHVFDQPDFFESDDRLDYANKRYRKKLQHYSGESVICDATPVTLFNPKYMQACVEYNPNARFIVLLRDPVERAESHYRMMKALGREDKSMLVAFLLEQKRLRDTENYEWSRRSPWRDWSYLHRGLYTSQLKFLYSLVRRDQVLIIEQSKLRDHHELTLDSIFSFVDLPKIEIKKETIFQRKPESSSFLDSLARIYARLFFVSHRLCSTFL